MQDIIEENPSLDKTSLLVMKLDLGSTSSIRSFVSDFKKSEFNCQHVIAIVISNIV